LRAGFADKFIIVQEKLFVILSEGRSAQNFGGHAAVKKCVASFDCEIPRWRSG
jgi:hypothetical protein